MTESKLLRSDSQSKVCFWALSKNNLVPEIFRIIFIVTINSSNSCKSPGNDTRAKDVRYPFVCFSHLCLLIAISL